MNGKAHGELGEAARSAVAEGGEVESRAKRSWRARGANANTCAWTACLAVGSGRESGGAKIGAADAHTARVLKTMTLCESGRGTTATRWAARKTLAAGSHDMMSECQRASSGRVNTVSSHLNRLLQMLTESLQMQRGRELRPIAKVNAKAGDGGAP